jgi:hypothetical protein
MNGLEFFGEIFKEFIYILVDILAIFGRYYKEIIYFLLGNIIFTSIFSKLELSLFNRRDIALTLGLTMCAGLLAASEMGSALIILGIMLLLFLWIYYREFEKPRDRRDYASIAASMGFFMGLILGVLFRWVTEAVILSGVLGGVILYFLWRFVVRAIGNKYPYLKPLHMRGDLEDLNHLYDDIGGEKEIE